MENLIRILIKIGCQLKSRRLGEDNHFCGKYPLTKSNCPFRLSIKHRQRTKGLRSVQEFFHLRGKKFSYGCIDFSLGTLINSTGEISSFSSTCKSTDITFRGQRQDTTGNDKLVKNFNLRVDHVKRVHCRLFECSIRG